MNMVYKNKKLYVELIGEINEEEIFLMKERLFVILDRVNIDEIEINIEDIFDLKKGIFSSFLEEYHNKYKGNIIISNK